MQQTTAQYRRPWESSADGSPTMSAEQRDAFRELYATHALSVYTTAMAILRKRDAAEDLVHDVFLRAWHQSDQFDASRGSVGVWLRAIARNLSIDRLRAARRLVSREDTSADGATPSNECLSGILADEKLGSVGRAFNQLSASHRQLIEMAYDRELSHSEIARELQLPLGTVKSRIRQALSQLRSHAATQTDDGCEDRSWLNPASQAFTTLTDLGTVEGQLKLTPNLTVLVVDDDEDTLKLISAILKKFRLSFRTAASARAGVLALEQAWPGVVICDLNMPDEDGYSLIGKARTMAQDRGQRLRAAAFTSWASEQERSRALVAGFDLYINKPVHPLALVSAVARLGR